MIVAPCHQCGILVHRYPSKIKHHLYCSMSCAGKANGEARRKSIRERVESNSSIPPGDKACWTFNGDRTPKGYGLLKLERGKRGKYVHRLMWQEVNGPIPDGLKILHTCDNPPCWRNDGTNSHLFRGTQADNNADRDAKGRVASGDRHGWAKHPELIPRGEQRGMGAKLNDAKVREIRQRAKNGETHTSMAPDYGVSVSTITRIVNRDRWDHVQ